MSDQTKDKEKNDNDNKELEDLKKKAEEYLDGWKRAKADYSNYKKEVEKRQQEIVEFANARMIADLLPIYENYKMAIKHIPENSAKDEWAVGLIYIQNQFQSFLNNLGIKEIKTAGEKFDPAVHEAVASEEKEGFDEGVIFEEVSAGYTLHGKVVVPAKVKVAK